MITNYKCIQRKINKYYAYPSAPSDLTSFGSPSPKPLAKPGCVWTRTFTASIGQRATSEITSADADPAR
ncbi:hypothetical protein Hanom_Chr14g01310571 [Helianthus anomalus]